MTDFDLIVIGAGAVGENVADYAHKRGLSVALVEEELVGGECSYWACMPSKALLRSGHAVRAAQRLEGAKQAVTGEVDPAAVFARRNSFTSDWKDDSQAEWVDSAGITLLRGHATITAPRTIDIAGETHTARGAIAVATGSLPTLPDIPGLAEAGAWSTREATSAQHVPESLLVIGGGVAGAELATAYRSLGSRVVIAARHGLLGGVEPFAGELVADSMRELGIDVRLGASPTSVERDEHGDAFTTFDDGTSLTTSEVLVTTGRVARTGDLGLENVGLTPGDWLKVDDTMLVEGTDWLYGVGDVNHRALLTHQGKYQARAAGEAIAARLQGTTLQNEPWGAHVATADHGAVPQVTFTDPEVASVGITEKQARENGLNVRAVEYELGSVAGASLQADGYSGRAKLVVDEDRHVAVGVTFVGQDVAEMLQAATIAIVGEVPIDRLWHAVPAYPTMNEIWLRLLETYGRP
jgi:dihydrolipoamide dehydrogenase